MKIITFLSIGILVLFIILLLTHRKEYGMHPKILWTYWDNPDTMPRSVTLCIESWKKFNPTYNVVVLTKHNFKQYITIPNEILLEPNFNDSPARFSDLLRLCLLAEHGGIWIDSSILLKEPLDTWLFPRPAEFSGFYISSFTKEGLPPVIESWFLACNKNSEFMRRWRDEFLEMAKYPSVEKYVESRKDMGVDYEKINGPVYLAIHVAAQKVLQIDTYPQDTLILKKAEDGPLKYLAENGWEPEKALIAACTNKSYQGPIMKMRGCERKALEPRLDTDLSPKNCGWLD
jgi:hypothetical protein